MIASPIGTRDCGITMGISADWLRWSKFQRSRITGQENTTIAIATPMKISSESEREHLLDGRRHHPDDDIHAKLPARPRHHAVAEEHAADHQKEHDLFRPVDRELKK